MTSTCCNIAIDGPAASGKSALGRRLAARLGYAFLDTGEMYRAVTALALERGVSVEDGLALTEIAATTRFELTMLTAEPGSEAPANQLWIGDRPAGDWLQTLEVDRNVSAVSRHPAVRAALVARQREIAANLNVAMAGRDIGAVVLPQATLKLYLEATPETRAQRRWRDLVARGVEADFGQILDDLVQRDVKDSTRATSPLRPAHDAVIIHTDHLTLDGEVELAARLLAAAR